MLKNQICVTAAALGGLLCVLMGGADDLLICLVVFVGCDVVTGVVRAAVSHTLSSAAAFRGIARKGMIFVLVGLTAQLDARLLAGGAACRAMLITFYIASEGLSIVENAAALGVPVPKRLKDALMQLGEDE